MCGVRMTLGRPRSSERNSSPRPLGSVGKTSTAAPARCPETSASRSAAWSITKPRDRLRKMLPVPHPGELLGAEEAGVAGPAVHVQGHHVGAGEQLVEAVAAVGVAQREPVGGVVEVDAHAQRLGEHGELGADVAVPDDAQRPAADLVAAVGGLVPDAVVHAGVLLGEPAGQRDDLGDGQLDDAAGVGERRVEDGDAAARGGGQVDLVGADAERADRQPGCGAASSAAALTWVLERMPSRSTPRAGGRSARPRRGPGRAARPGTPRSPGGRPRRGGCPPAAGRAPAVVIHAKNPSLSAATSGCERGARPAPDRPPRSLADPSDTPPKPNSTTVGNAVGGATRDGAGQVVTPRSNGCRRWP